MITNIPPTIVRKIFLNIIDELPLERILELLEFALFMKARHMKQPFQAEAYLEKFISPSPINAPTTVYPLQGTVIFYHDPFVPVAESDWEILS